MAKLWWAGWILAAAALLGTAWALGRASAYNAAIVDVYSMADDVDRLHTNGRQQLVDLKKFEQHQDVEAAAILEVGAYLRQREQITEYNRRVVADGFGAKVKGRR